MKKTIISIIIMLILLSSMVFGATLNNTCKEKEKAINNLTKITIEKVLVLAFLGPIALLVFIIQDKETIKEIIQSGC